MLVFENELSLQCRDWIVARVEQLGKERDEHDPELKLYTRILGFPFERYPDYTVPWHLLMYPHMRWMHVGHIVQILESFRQPTGSHVGAPIHLEPFQIMIILAFLGPQDPDTGLRIVREGLLTLGRKNGKTALVAGLAAALMCLHPDDHGLRGQEIQVGAADRDQAGITHMMAERFISMDDTLGVARKFRSVPSKKTLTHNATLTMLKCLSSDAYRQLGGNPVMVLLDEIGNVPGTAAEEFYSALTTGYGAQDEPLTLLLSTQAPNDQHFFSQQVDRAKRYNEGMGSDPTFAGFVFTLPEVDQDGNDISPFEESLWYLANPGLGTICNLADLQGWSKRARELPSLQNKYENLKMNRRVSETAAFLTRTAWEQNNVPFEMEQLIGLDCTLGLDLSETTDLTALCALFEPIEMMVNGVIEMRQPILMFYWIPGEGLQERSKVDHVPYDVWAREGLIDVKSSKVVDYSRVARQIIELINTYEVIALGFDRWRMRYLTKALEDEGFEFFSEEEQKEFLIEIGQGFKDQTRSVEVLEGLAVESKLAHAGHAILRWNIANTVVVSDPANNRKFDKIKSYGRIDGTVALALAAHARSEFEIDDDGPSMYDDPDYAEDLVM